MRRHERTQNEVIEEAVHKALSDFTEALLERTEKPTLKAVREGVFKKARQVKCRGCGRKSWWCRTLPGTTETEANMLCDDCYGMAMDSRRGESKAGEASA
jgi:hypothetical protein